MKTNTIWQPVTQQRVFRDIVECFSRPGTVRQLVNTIDQTNALTTVLATLMDGETTLADPHGLIKQTDWPLLQARQVAPDCARYVVADGERAPDFQPALGTLASPEFGATILINLSAFGNGPLHLTLSGPGVSGQTELCLAGLHRDWLEQRINWVADFPLGVDMLFCTETHIAALPRTTHVSIASATKGAA